jgi:protoporphyrinogen oxidase
MKVTIIGSGMAGYGAAYRLSNEGIKPAMYEMNSYYGGHAASFRSEDGFIFDDGPHVSFTKDTRIQKLFADSINNEYQVLQAQINNYWRGYWIKHPAQVNLYGLPKDLVIRIITEFAENKYRRNNDVDIHNYQDWLYAQFGKTFAENFPMEYGLKYHTTEAANMSTDWLGPRIYTPELTEVLEGALSPSTPDVHYVTHFRYPTENGFISYLNAFVGLSELHLDHPIKRITPAIKELEFTNGVKQSYEHLISSIPIPELISITEDVPADVLEAARKLACTSCVIVNLGINREDVSETHWTYIYDQDFFITRLSFPHLFSPNNVPRGTSSIQAEIYFSKKYRPLDRRPEEYIEPAINDLRRCGLIRDNDIILHKTSRLVKYANVIFDLDRAAALSIVRGYLDDIDIVSCGRYGEWGYHWTDESFKSGEEAAEKIIKSHT